MTKEDDPAVEVSEETEPAASTTVAVLDRETYDIQMIQRWGNLMHASGLFPDVKSMAQAAVKIMVGRELGFSVMASMSGVHLVDGKPVLGAGLMASALKESTKYDYDVVTHTDERCVIAVFEYVDEKKVSIGTSEFTIADAELAKLFGRPSQTWEKYPRNMLFSRAMSNAIAWFAPDVFEQRIYTPEELGLPVGEQGDVIDATMIATAEPVEGIAEGETTQPDVAKVEEEAPAAGGQTPLGPDLIENAGMFVVWAIEFAQAHRLEKLSSVQIAQMVGVERVADLAPAFKGKWEVAVERFTRAVDSSESDATEEEANPEPPEPPSEPMTAAEATEGGPDYLAQAAAASAAGDEARARATEGGDGDGAE